MTPEKTFQVPDIATVTLTDLNDILTAAVEGGINYWAQSRNYRWENVEETTVEIRDFYDSDSPIHKTWLKVSATDLLPILPKISEHSSQANGWNIREIIENHDADIADIAVQLIVFGQVKYG